MIKDGFKKLLNSYSSYELIIIYAAKIRINRKIKHFIIIVHK